MGTPDFAVASLRILVENKYDVVGVITMPDKPAGRGHKVQYSAVKQYALEQNLKLLQPEKLKDEAFLEELSSLQADLQIVVAFRMLPEVVWDMPKYGTFNLHASLLPQYRGAAPINWAIINGDKETGATTFFLTHEIDTGKIIQQEKITIAETDNAGIVHDRLMEMGAKLVKKTVDMLLEGKIDAVDQVQFIHPDMELKAAPKIFKETCQIDLSWGVERVYNFVRGLSPAYSAWAYFFCIGSSPVVVKIIDSEKVFSEKKIWKYGDLEIDNHRLMISCKGGYINVLSIQFPDKKKLTTVDFLRGYSNKKFSSFCFDCNHAKYNILNTLNSSPRKTLSYDVIKDEIIKSLKSQDEKLIKQVNLKIAEYLKDNSVLLKSKYIDKLINSDKTIDFKITTKGIDFFYDNFSTSIYNL